jgi:hypothetical protein
LARCDRLDFTGLEERSSTQTGSGSGRKANTVERLRVEIDSGQTGAKVNFPDPAAAPLGSDDEAAGNSPDRAVIDRAQIQEVVRPPYSRWTAGPVLYASFIIMLVVTGLLLILKES